jgi:hypothetical protein
LLIESKTPHCSKITKKYLHKIKIPLDWNTLQCSLEFHATEEYWRQSKYHIPSTYYSTLIHKRCNFVLFQNKKIQPEYEELPI